MGLKEFIFSLGGLIIITIGLLLTLILSLQIKDAFPKSYSLIGLGAGLGFMIIAFTIYYLTATSKEK
jgi:hypothetical protein